MAVERTLSIIKPDAVAKNVIGQVYSRFEGSGLKIIAAKMVHLSRNDAEQAQHIGNFMRVGKHGGGAMRDDGGGKFGGGQHAAFNMHMAVAQTGDHEPPVSLDHLRNWPDTMRCIRPDKSKAPISNGHLPAVQHFARLDIHQFTAANDGVRGGTAGGHSDKAGGAFSP